MTFLTWAALAIGALVLAPLLAHLLRRRPPRVLPFAGAALVPQSAAVTKRRQSIEDRALFALRALAVIALALLGATPLLQCNRLSVARQGGASVALAVVLDDSLSMRAAATSDAGPSRFQRAREAAVELVEGLESGDVVAVVLAGAPSRVALAATTNLGAAEEVLRGAQQSDRGTDLEGALIHAQELLRELPHEDRRVVLLSDLLDATETDRPLAVEEGIRLWAPLGPMGEQRPDCAVVQADWVRGKVVARVACGPGGRSARASVEPDGGLTADAGVDSVTRRDQRSDPAGSRRLVVRRGEREIGGAPLRVDSNASDVVLATGDSSPQSAPTGTASAAASAESTAGDAGPRPAAPTEHAYVELTGGDAIGADDRAPVLEPSTLLRIGVVADAESSRPPTGGPPPIEQALAALGQAGHLSLLTAVPDEAEALQALSVLVVDDAPGFAPEVRRRLSSWLERGGVLVLTLGPRAGAARLGSGFAPILPAVVRWSAWSGVPGVASEPVVAGIDPDTDDWFGPTAEGLLQLEPAGRARLELAPGQEIRVRTRWSDGQPFLVERRTGRGVTFALTLPLGVGFSDFPLRPGFLLSLQRVIDTARTLGGVARSPVGTPWWLPAGGEVSAERLTAAGAAEPLAVETREEQRQIVPERLGLYRLTIDGITTYRVAAVDERELLARPRAVGDEADDPRLGGMTASVDVSRHVALALLLLLAAELALRAAARRREAANG